MTIGLVEWRPSTIIGSSDDGAGHVKANVADDDLATYFKAPTANGGWVGYSGDAAVTPRSFFITPPPNTLAEPDIDYSLVDGVIESSSVSDFSSDVVLHNTIPRHPYLGFRYVNEIAINSPRAAQHWRYRGADGTYCMIGFLGFIIDAGDTLEARPVRPTVGPTWGGGFPSGEAQVILTSRTADAPIYYTEDGSVAETTDSLYAGEFTLDSFGASKQLRVRAHDVALDEPYSVEALDIPIYYDHEIAPGEFILDNRGHRLEAHNAGVIRHDGEYYIIGTSGERFSVNASGFSSNLDTNGSTGFNLYAASNLRHPEFIGNILPVPSGVSKVLRGHIRQRASDGKFVGWCRSWPESKACVFISSSSNLRTCTWSWLTTDAGIALVGDCNFVILDDEPYFLSAANEQIRIYPLTSDYENIIGTSLLLPGTNALEAPFAFEIYGTSIIGGTTLFTYDADTVAAKMGYFYNRGDIMTLADWKPVEAVYIIYPFPAAGSDFNVQSSEVFFIDDDEEKPMMWTDRWHDDANGMHRSTYLSLEVSMIGKVQLVIRTPATRNYSDAFNHVPVPPNNILAKTDVLYRADENDGVLIDDISGINMPQTGTVDNNNFTYNGKGANLLARGPYNTGNFHSSSNAIFKPSGMTPRFVGLWYKSLGSNAVIAHQDDFSANRDFGFWDNGDGTVQVYAMQADSTVKLTSLVAVDMSDFVFLLAQFTPSGSDVELSLQVGKKDYTGGSTLSAPVTVTLTGGAHAVAMPDFGIGNLFGAIAAIDMLIYGQDNLTSDEANALYNGGAGASKEDLELSAITSSITVTHSGATGVVSAISAGPVTNAAIVVSHSGAAGAVSFTTAVPTFNANIVALHSGAIGVITSTFAPVGEFTSNIIVAHSGATFSAAGTTTLPSFSSAIAVTHNGPTAAANLSFTASGEFGFDVVVTFPNAIFVADVEVEFPANYVDTIYSDVCFDYIISEAEIIV